MNDIFAERSNYEQTVQINELLGADEDYFNLYELFKYLPKTLIDKTIKMHISIDGISYTDELGYSPLKFSVPENGNIYDSFIDVLKYVINND